MAMSEIEIPILKIEAPEGYEIDKEKSSFEKIFFKKIETKLPLCVSEIPKRYWYVDSYGDVEHLQAEHPNENQLSTKERAEAFLALMQLVELRDAWNGDWKPDWNNIYQQKHIIEFYNGEISLSHYNHSQTVLHFKTLELRDQFAKQFQDLILTAKELL